MGYEGDEREGKKRTKTGPSYAAEAETEVKVVERMPSQYPSESRLAPPLPVGGSMVAGNHAVPNGKAGDVVHMAVLDGERVKEQRTISNGVLTHSALIEAVARAPLKLRSPTASEERKTSGQSTREATTGKERGRELERTVCSQLALSYTSSILSRRAGRVNTRQRELDLRLAQLQCRARSRQGRTVCWHILAQLRADKKRREGEERERSAEWEEGRERGVEGRERGKEGRERGEEGRERGEEGRERDAEREEERERSMEGEIPMQVDGAVEERYLKQPDPGQLASQPRGREEVGASFSLLPASPGVLDVCGMSVQPEWCPREEVVGRWRQQLRAVCVGEGGEETESSSDEESGEEPQGQRRRR